MRRNNAYRFTPPGAGRPVHVQSSGFGSGFEFQVSVFQPGWTLNAGISYFLTPGVICVSRLSVPRM
jgi:hypothetical protein